MNTGYRINLKQKAIVATQNYPTIADFPAVANPNLYYMDLSDGKVYQWQSGSYVEIEPEIDANGQFVSISGDPQYVRNTPLTSPIYRVINLDSCSIDPSNEVTLVVNGFYEDITQRFNFSATVSSVLDNDLAVSFGFTYNENGFSTVGFTQMITILAGELEGTKFENYFTVNPITDVQPNIQTVLPNPNGTKTIIY